MDNGTLPMTTLFVFTLPNKKNQKKNRNKFREERGNDQKRLLVSPNTCLS